MNNLAKLRKLRGLSQADLAEMTGLNQSTIQRAESEHASAKLETYKKCGNALGFTLGQIFSDSRQTLEKELLTALRLVQEGRLSEIQDLLEGQEDLKNIVDR